MKRERKRRESRRGGEKAKIDVLRGKRKRGRETCVANKERKGENRGVRK